MKKVTFKILSHLVIFVGGVFLIAPSLAGFITGGLHAAHNITRKAIENRMGTNIDYSKVKRVTPD